MGSEKTKDDKKDKKVLKKLKKQEKKLQKKLKRLAKKKKKKGSSSSSSSTSSSAKGGGATRSKAPPAAPLEQSREELGLMLLGERYNAEAEKLQRKGARWEYPLRDEHRRCFAGVLKPPISSSTLDTLREQVAEGALWDQPKRPGGELLPRKTDWMVAERCKCTYKYGGVEVDPTAFPDWMIEIMERCMPLCGLRSRGTWPNCCNLNLYEDGGMAVGWHADDEELFQGKVGDCPIISFSLGAARSFELRLSGAEDGAPPSCRLRLEAGDLLTMEGLTQKHYQHRVPKEKASGPRINLTWRWIRKHRPRCPCSR